MDLVAQFEEQGCGEVDSSGKILLVWAADKLTAETAVKWRSTKWLLKTQK